MSDTLKANQHVLADELRAAAQQFVRPEGQALSLSELVETSVRVFGESETIKATAVWIVENSDKILLAGHNGLDHYGIDADATPDCGIGDWLVHVMQQRICMLQSGRAHEKSFDDILLLPILFQQQAIGVIGLLINEGIADDSTEQPSEVPGRADLNASKDLYGGEESKVDAQQADDHGHDIAEAASHLVTAIAKAMVVPLEQRWAIDPVRAFGEFDQLCQSIHGSLSVRSVSRRIVDGSKSFSRCDRVSLYLKKGLRWIPTAVSGTETINRRSEQVERLTHLVRKTTRTRQPFVYDGSEIELGQQVSELTANYIETAGSKYLCIIPVFSQHESQSEPVQSPKPGAIIGAIVFEYFHRSQSHPMLSRHQDSILKQVSTALWNARRYDRIFLRPLLDAAGRFTSSITTTKWSIIIAVVAAFGALGWMATTTTVPHYVNAEGRLMPVLQRRVFAPEIARVTEVLVESGQRVEQGQPLVQLEDLILASEMNRVQENIAQKKKHLAALEGSLFTISRSGSRFEMIDTQAKIEQTKIEIAGLEQEQRILEARKENLLVRSPIAGIVASFRPKDTLQDRPVQRGDQIMEIMDDQGPRRLELHIPERDIGHVVSYMQSQKGQTTDIADATTVPVNYRFLSSPEVSHPGNLSELSTRMAIDESGTHSMLVYVSPESPETNHKIGAVVSAKIDCGPRSLAYAWTVNLWRFAQRKFWLDDDWLPSF